MPVSQAFKDRLNDEFLDAKCFIADPPADAVIEKVIADSGKKGALDLFNHLIREIELPLDKLPAVVQEFVQQHHKLPIWADEAKLKIAEEFFIDHGTKFLIFLYYKSLPTLYSCGKSAGVLVQTGRLAHDGKNMEIFSRRVAETGQFLLEVMAPGGLRNQGPGIGFALKVRLIHASIRKFIPDTAWDRKTQGQPINQEELAGTLMTFSTTLIDGLEQFSIYEPAEKKEAYLHAWKIVGHLLGIDADLLPGNVAEGRYLLKRTLDRHLFPSENGVLLTKALIDFGKGLIPYEKVKIAPETLIRFLNSKEISDALGVTEPAGCLAQLIPLSLRSIFNLEEKIEDKIIARSGSLQFVIDALSMKILEKSVQVFDKYKNRNFHVPDSLKNRWNM